MNEFRKKISRSRRTLVSVFRFPVSPRRHFRRLVIALSVLLLGVVLFHVYYFYEVESQAFFQATDTAAQSAPVVDEVKLTNVLSHYEDKAAIRTQATQLVPVVLEPSK